jgi:hypothetical protein
MPHKYLLLLLSLAVGLGGCKQNEPEPESEPVLAGRWPMYSITYLEYDSLGRQTGQTPELVFPPERGYYLAVTDSTMQQYFADGTPYATLRHYTLTGNVLTYRGGEYASWNNTITLLTATELRILEKYTLLQNGRRFYVGEDHHYLRPQ